MPSVDKSFSRSCRSPAPPDRPESAGKDRAFNRSEKLIGVRRYRLVSFGNEQDFGQIGLIPGGIKASKRAEEAAKHLGIDPQEFEGEMLSRVESALIKLHLRYCKKEKCSECPMREFCEENEREDA